MLSPVLPAGAPHLIDHEPGTIDPCVQTVPAGPTAEVAESPHEFSCTAGAAGPRMAFMDSDALVAEQVAYYRARADEYDDWWLRRHDYDDGQEFAAAWRRDIDQLKVWLHSHGPLGNTLELAAGTGNWTAELTTRATAVMAVDASPEALRINAAKLAPSAPRPSYVVADTGFTIVKRYWTPEDLTDLLRPLGWDAQCGETTFAFLYGSARRRDRVPPG
jgi:SAM-dependent methyltransferase